VLTYGCRHRHPAATVNNMFIVYVLLSYQRLSAGPSLLRIANLLRQLLSFSATQRPAAMTGYNFVGDRRRPCMSAPPRLGQAPGLGLDSTPPPRLPDDDGIRPSTQRRRRSQEIKQRL